MIFIQRIIDWLKSYGSDPYEYGTMNGMRARRHKRTKQVDFVLWEKGHGGRSDDYWHIVGAGHEDKFRAYL